MAYSPVERGRILRRAVLQRIARQHGATPAQIALAWVLRQGGVIAIPKTAESEHVVENRKALEVRLTEEDLVALDQEFPPPAHKVPLDML
jgi:diketogulonate reductase-like aldo/keto reductase